MMDEADPKGNPIGTELVFDWRMRAIARGAAARALGVIAVTVGLATGAPAAAAPSGEVRIGLAAEPNTFDPHLTVGRNTQIFVVNVYDG